MSIIQTFTAKAGRGFLFFLKGGIIKRTLNGKTKQHNTIQKWRN
ncbi:hypothetical protein AB9M62_00850 [Bacillales bacterium AN1005]